MKALSVDTYWAMLISTNEKNIEFRTWKTKYRGNIIICSNSHKLRNMHIHSKALSIVELVDIVPYSHKKHSAHSLMPDMPDMPGYAWIFSPNCKIIKPCYVKGKLKLFDIDIYKETINVKSPVATWDYWHSLGLVPNRRLLT